MSAQLGRVLSRAWEALTAGAEEGRRPHTKPLGQGALGVVVGGVVAAHKTRGAGTPWRAAFEQRSTAVAQIVVGAEHERSRGRGLGWLAQQTRLREPVKLSLEVPKRPRHWLLPRPAWGPLRPRWGPKPRRRA